MALGLMSGIVAAVEWMTGAVGVELELEPQLEPQSEVEIVKDAGVLGEVVVAAEAEGID
jgi:hypothetical protein